MGFDEEQEKIFKEILEFRAKLGKGYNKLKGDATCRLIKAGLEKHLRQDLKVVGPNEYVEELLGDEIDLIVVKKNARRNLDGYRGEDIACLIEVKTSGVMNDNDLNALQRQFDGWHSKLPKVKKAYLTVMENVCGKNSYGVIIKRELKPHGAFILAHAYGKKETQKGEWEHFVYFINN